jgi:acetyl-CoA decarbonylase/synthase complex subunit gamma
MRQVRFALRDRIVLIPVELVQAAKYALFVAVCLLVLGGLGAHGYTLARVWDGGAKSALLFLAAYLFGVVVPPTLLPWLPGRAFATKGAVAGLVFGLAVAGHFMAHPRAGTPVEAAAWLFIGPAVASFLAMNFTGASTYTSLSGVRREMAYAVPAQAVAGTLGLALWLVGRFV